MICTTSPSNISAHSSAAFSPGIQSAGSARQVFVCEYVTGGGLYREAIPAALAQEALLMRNAMLQGILALGMQVSVVHDPRLPAPAAACEVHILQPGEDPWARWQQAIQDSELTWLVAPESGGALEKLSAMVLAAKRGLLSCAPAAVALAASKYASYCRLQNAGLNVVPTWRAQAFFAQALQQAHPLWVAKPDDGISCDGLALFQDLDAMHAWLSAGRMQSYVIQPYISGQSASISMLCRGGQAWLLSCNTQVITQHQDMDITALQYQGSVVNGMAQHWSHFEHMAAQIALAMPELFGYVGVDVLVDAAGDLHILEVNPRLTTSFAGIAQAIGYNPACLLMDLFYNEHFTLPPDLQRNRIEIKLND